MQHIKWDHESEKKKHNLRLLSKGCKKFLVNNGIEIIALNLKNAERKCNFYHGSVF